MNRESRICQNCKQNFTIEPEDFKFYEKISVPPPTWCPECRMVRRFMYRNERTLYRRKCDLCKKDIISNFSPDHNFPVYCADCWWSDKWDPTEFAHEYDFSKSFFKQYHEMEEKIPHLNFWAFSNINSDYAGYSAYSKNVYLSPSTVSSENVYYSSYIDKSFDIFDSDKVRNSELCYENMRGSNNHTSRFMLSSRDCIDSWFLYDCTHCQNCFMSSNLRNKKFYIRNKAYTKENYFKELKKMNVGSAKSIWRLKEEFIQMCLHSLHRFSMIIKSENVTGDNVFNSRNAQDVYYAEELENVKHGWRTYNTKDAYDVSGIIFSELCYETTTGGDHNYLGKFYSHSKSVSNIEYSNFCPDSSNIFGCYGLRSKSYAILNKQYTNEEYKALVSKITKHMNDMPYIDKKEKIYKYGEFFPPELSPFAYNETMAQEYFQLTKTEANEKGYSWKEPEEKNYQPTLLNDQISDHINDITDDILDQIIECQHKGLCQEQCTKALRIITPELAFYRKMHLPIPRLCPNCRYHERIQYRNPLKLWHRQCMCTSTSSAQAAYQNTIKHNHEGRCPNEFETTYAPERSEIIYCERCYLKEVV